MAKILIGYELGGGLGHIRRLQPVAQALAAEGHQVVFFLRNIREASVLLNREPLPVIAVPDMLARLPGFPQPARLGAYSDIMACAGFYFVDQLYTATLAWQTLFEQVRPDLIVADHSPVCCLAAFGQIPVVLFGNGFCLPPAQGEAFPPFRAKRPILVEPEKLLNNMREVQRRRGRLAPETVTEPFRTAARLVGTVPELDPHAEIRQDPVVGPNREDVLAPIAAPKSPRYFAYLSLDHKQTAPVLEGLAKSRLPGEVFVRGMTDDIAKKLARPHLTVHRAPVPIAEALARASVVIQHGSNGTSCAALTAGRPQVVVPVHQESGITGEALVRAGVGRIIPRDKAAEAAQIAEALSRDATTMGKAQELARSLKSRGPWRGYERVVEACRNVLEKRIAA